MNNLYRSILMILGILILFNARSFSQIVRGTEPGEIYLYCLWYIDTAFHNGVFHSYDNGATLSVQCKRGEGFTLRSDSIAGNVYLLGRDSIIRSEDYGHTWNGTSSLSWANFFATGCVPGELYKSSDHIPDNPGLQRSVDFGASFQTTDPNFLPNVLIDVGTVPGEVYAYRWDSDWDTLEFKYSQNWGYSFTSILVDTSILDPYYFLQVMPYFSRGATPGEFYLVRADKDARFRVFHTMDNGETFEYNYITEPCELCLSSGDEISFTGGRVPGSFYIMRAFLDLWTQDHTDLCIDYSEDYGKTYTTWCYNLDSTFTGIGNHNVDHNFLMQNNPNPFRDKTSIEYYLDKPGHAVIIVNDLLGNKIKTIADGDYSIGKHMLLWDGTDEHGTRMPPGVYLYRLVINDMNVATRKAVLY